MRCTSILAAAAALLGGACSEAPPSSGPPDGAALFREQNCVQCHGPDALGTNLGPNLHGKREFWTREKLAAYLVDPQALIKGNERLEKQATLYMLPMVKFIGLSLEQRLALADYVLKLP